MAAEIGATSRGTGLEGAGRHECSRRSDILRTVHVHSGPTRKPNLADLGDESNRCTIFRCKVGRGARQLAPRGGVVMKPHSDAGCSDLLARVRC